MHVFRLMNSQLLEHSSQGVPKRGFSASAQLDQDRILMYQISKWGDKKQTKSLTIKPYTIPGADPWKRSTSKTSHLLPDHLAQISSGFDASAYTFKSKNPASTTQH